MSDHLAAAREPESTKPELSAEPESAPEPTTEFEPEADAPEPEADAPEPTTEFERESAPEADALEPEAEAEAIAEAEPELEADVPEPEAEPDAVSEAEPEPAAELTLEADAPEPELTPEAEPADGEHEYDAAPAAESLEEPDDETSHDQDHESEEAAESEATAPAAPTGPRTAGRLIAETLRAAGVRFAFTVPGESFLGLLEALPAAGIRVITTRHEGGAAFMAEAIGQLTGRPAACLATRAVGAANLAIGIHTARQDSTPMFAIAGQVQRSFRGREAFQEADLAASLGGLAKWAREPHTVDELPEVLGEAVREALGGRPGPVFLSLPEDLLDEIVPDDMTVDVRRSPAPRPSEDDLRQVLHLLASARRPVILAGAGVLRARTSNDLIRLAELLRAPVIASWRRGDVISNDHPLFLGMAGLSAPAVVRDRLERADAVLVLGCRLNEPTSYAWRIPSEGVPWAHVDLAPRPADGSPGAPTHSIRSDARTFLRDAYALLKSAAILAEPADARTAANETDRAAWEVATTVDGGEWDGPGVHPGRVMTILRRVLPDEAILTTDAGNFGGWVARGFRFRRPGTFLGPTSGAMGYGLPAAIAASIVHRDRPVVALCGDGGLGMSLAELETATREGLRPVVIVFDNERYGTIRVHQDRRPGEAIGTDLGPIDFAAVARACGARGIRVERDSALEPVLRQALAADRPTVIQLALDRSWRSVDDPPTG